MEDKSNWSFNRSSNLFIHCEAALQVLCCWLLMMVMLLNKISHLEFTFRKSQKQQQQLTFVHVFILRLNSLTQSQEQSHTHIHTHSSPMQSLSSLNLPELLILHLVLLSASDGVWECMPFNIWDQYLVLHQHKHCHAAFWPTLLFVVLRGSSLDWRVHSKDGRF